MKREHAENLSIALAMAVPLHVQEWKVKQPRQSDYDDIRKRLPKLIGEKGDILLFGGGKKGEVGYIFNEVARAIALLSFLPGGITIFGEHYENG